MTKPNSEEPRFRRGDIFEVRDSEYLMKPTGWIGTVGVVTDVQDTLVCFQPIVPMDKKNTQGYDGGDEDMFEMGSNVARSAVIIGRYDET